MQGRCASAVISSRGSQRVPSRSKLFALIDAKVENPLDFSWSIIVGKF